MECSDDLSHKIAFIECPAPLNRFLPWLSFNAHGPLMLMVCKVSTGNSRWSQFLEKRQDHPHFLHSLSLLMHSDVLLAFLGSKCYPADSLPTSPSSCSAPENGTEWKGPDIVRSGDVVKGNWVAVRSAQVDGMLGT